MDYQKKGDISADNFSLILISVDFLLLFNKKIIYITYSDYIILVDPCQLLVYQNFQDENCQEGENYNPDKEKQASYLSGYKIIPRCPKV